MANPPPPPGFKLISDDDPYDQLIAEGFVPTNGFRTQADIEQIRAQGYKPAANSLHLDGDAVDLIHPTLSAAEQERRVRELMEPWGARVLNEGHHTHAQKPGWGRAPGTPGTDRSGLPPLPDGFQLTQRGSLGGGNFVSAPILKQNEPELPEGTRRQSTTNPPERDPVDLRRAPKLPTAEDGNVRLEQAWHDGGTYSSVDPAKNSQLQAAFEAGAGYGDILRLAGEIQATVNKGDLARAIAWRTANKGRTRDAQGRSVRFSPDDAVTIAPAAQDPPGSKTAEELSREAFERMHGPQGEISSLTTPEGYGKTIPQRFGNLAREFGELIDHPYAGRMGSEAETIAEWVPFIGGASSIEQAGTDVEQGRYGSAAVNAALGGIDFIPGVAIGGKIIAKNADDAIANISQMIGRDLTTAERAAIQGASATPSAGSGTVDVGEVLQSLDGPEFTAARERLAAMPNEADVPSLSADVPPARVVDRIDVGNMPPPPPGFRLIEEPQLGRARPMDEQASAEEIATLARNARPEDVTPIPANQVDSLDEARAMPTPQELITAPDPWKELRGRTIPGKRDSSKSWTHKGPIDAEAFLRRSGGLKDSGGELRYIGITGNAPPSYAPGEHRLGKIIDNENGLDLDEATHRLWEAGYFPDHVERPMIEDMIDLLRDSRAGKRTYHPDDFEEIDRFDGALADRGRVENAELGGVPLVNDRGQPIGLDDLRANDPPATAYEDLPTVGGRVGNINLARMETRGDIRRALQNTEIRFGGFDAARRGKITQAETAALASELRMTPDDLMRRRKGQALNAEQALAARRILAQSADELVGIASKVRGGSDEEIAKFQRALLRHAAIQEQVTGATSEAGRALAQFKMVARARDARARVLQYVIEGAGGRGRLEDVAEAILDLQRDPAMLNRIALQATKPRLKDKLVELWVNSLLSGPQTHAVNFVSNLLTQIGHIPENMVAAGIGAGRRGVGRATGTKIGMDRMPFSEAGARAVGMVSGVKRGLVNGWQAFKTEMPSDMMGKAEQLQQRAISGTKGKVLRLPTRAMMGVDELFKGMARQSALDGLAIRNAHKEGLRGEAMRERAAALAANPTDEMMEEAYDFARYATFQRPVGPIGSAVMRAKEQHPALALIVPFIRTPTNLLKYAVERSPLAPALSAWRADFMAGGAKRDVAIARAMVGSGIAASAMLWAAEGKITGGGPADQNATRLMRANGWQPYSVKVGDTWVSYQRLDPYATILGIAADMATKMDKMTPAQEQQGAATLVTAVLKQLESKTWISGLVDLVKAIDSPQQYGQSFVGRLAGSIAVPTGVNQITKTIDPVQRDRIDVHGLPDWADSSVSRILSRIPGLSDNLPAKRDIFGKEMTSEGGAGPDILSPLWLSTNRHDPVAEELLRLDVTLDKPQRTVNHVRLGAEDYNAYQERSGGYIYEDVGAAMADPQWQLLTDEERLGDIDKIKRDARKAAREELGLGVPPPPPGFRAASSGRPPSSAGESLPPPPPGFTIQ